MKKSVQCAHYLVYLANRSGRTITNMHLPKLLYLAEAFLLADKNRSLFSDPIEAGEFGPIINAVRIEFIEYGGRPIDLSNDSFLSRISPWAKTYYFNDLSRDDKEHLLSVYDTFLKAGYSWEALGCFVRESSYGKTPWQEAYEKGQYTEIHRESMKEFYKIYLSETEKDAREKTN